MLKKLAQLFEVLNLLPQNKKKEFQKYLHKIKRIAKKGKE